MRIFLAGIMQGSHLAAVLHNQNYRQRLSQLLAQHLPDCWVYDPLADHQDSLNYHDGQAREVFLRHNRLCAEVDVVVAFIPEASMGTAIEIWEAHRHGQIVISISPLKHNWVVKFCSDRVFDSLEELEGALESGRLARDLKELQESRAATRSAGSDK